MIFHGSTSQLEVPCLPCEGKEGSLDERLESMLIEEMGHISSELAHDLRSPLQTIQNAVFLLERSPNNPVFYEMIKLSLRQCTDILDNFRDYYKGHILKLVEAELSNSYEMALAELSVPENVKLTSEIDELPPIIMDPAKVAQVFKKLIKNSLDAMPEGGEIRVRIRDAGSAVQVSVSDTGRGIKEEVKPVIYTPFVSKVKNGKGLGLPAAKRIIEAHGGAIEYVTAQGDGTTFTFTLPKRTKL
jgi:two-component system sporulation sensor kinase A